MADRPFPLAELTQRCRERVALMAELEWSEANDGPGHIVKPSQILALAASLQQFRQWLVAERDALKPLARIGEVSTPTSANYFGKYEALDFALAEFDRAVSLEIEGRQE